MQNQKIYTKSGGLSMFAEERKIPTEKKRLTALKMRQKEVGKKPNLEHTLKD